LCKTHNASLKKSDTVGIRTPSTAMVTNSKTEYVRFNFLSHDASMFTVYESMSAFSRQNKSLSDFLLRLIFTLKSSEDLKTRTNH